MDGVLIPFAWGSGEENMARDQHMAMVAGRRSCAALRVYGWKEPTLSLGHFQQETDIPNRLKRIAQIRRPTGGGAIVHHREVTYALAIPVDPARNVKGEESRLYAVVHEAVERGLRKLGWPARQAGESSGTQPNGTAHPFLCFERRYPVDLVLGESKILGSAQRRLSSCVLQHGSLLLAKSDQLTPHLEGVCDFPERLPVEQSDSVAWGLSESTWGDARTTEANMLAGWGAWMAWVIQVAVSESLKMKWSQASALDWLEMDSGNSSIRGS
jgi:lipoate-protein ligase A